MASIALDPAYRRVSVEEFLAMDFGGPKAELEDGIIFMMAGGTEAHARIAGNVQAFLRNALRGTGCRPYGSDLAVRTGERTIRFPDVSIYCSDPLTPEDGDRQLLGDPQVVVEVLSPSTSSLDQKVKLEEYRTLPGVHQIVFVDPRAERVRTINRIAEEWRDRWLLSGEDLAFPSLGLSIPHAEIFARD